MTLAAARCLNEMSVIECLTAVVFWSSNVLVCEPVSDQNNGSTIYSGVICTCAKQQIMFGSINCSKSINFGNTFLLYTHQ